MSSQTPGFRYSWRIFYALVDGLHSCQPMSPTWCPGYGMHFQQGPSSGPLICEQRAGHQLAPGGAGFRVTGWHSSTPKKHISDIFFMESNFPTEKWARSMSSDNGWNPQPMIWSQFYLVNGLWIRGFSISMRKFHMDAPHIFTLQIHSSPWNIGGPGPRETVSLIICSNTPRKHPCAQYLTIVLKTP